MMAIFTVASAIRLKDNSRIRNTVLAVTAVSFCLCHVESCLGKDRTWTDRKGRTLVAEALRVEGDKVILRRKKDGKVFRLAISKLDDKDQRWLGFKFGRNVKNQRARQPAGNGNRKVAAAGGRYLQPVPEVETVIDAVVERGGRLDKAAIQHGTEELGQLENDIIVRGVLFHDHKQFSSQRLDERGRIAVLCFLKLTSNTTKFDETVARINEEIIRNSQDLVERSNAMHSLAAHYARNTELYHESGGKIGSDDTEKARALVAVQREGLESEDDQAYSPAVASTMFLRDLAKPNLDLLSERLKEQQGALEAYRADLDTKFGQ